MKRLTKNFTQLSLLVITCCFFAACKTPNTLPQTKNHKPNIILILADDLGWSDIGCYGSEVNTPNLDKLANNGMRFTQFHNTAKCFPSRACLITGVYAQDCGYDKTFINPITNAVTFGEVLQSAGYLTYWSGKHHGKENPYTRGFDHYFGLKDGACNFFNPGIQRPGEPAPAAKRYTREWCIDDQFHQPYTPKEKDFYTTDYFTNYALEYIAEAGEKKQPFFLYLAYNAPHDPLMAWPEDIKKYKGKYEEGYTAIRQKRYEKQKRMGLIDDNYKLSEPTYKPWNSLSAKERQFEAAKMEVYAAMIDRMDQNIGRVLDKLKSLKMDKNTLILFVSDNGASAEVVNLKNDDDTAPIGSMARWLSLGKDWANVGNTPFRFYKNYSYEGGINTPCIAFWPGKITPNSFNNFPSHFIDIMPTLVEISGATYPKEHHGEKITPLRGQSLLPILKSGKIIREKPIFWQWRNGEAMKKGDWKIVKHGKGKPWDLYNTTLDPTETNNLAESEPEIVTEMDLLYQEWLMQYDGDAN